MAAAKTPRSGGARKPRRKISKNVTNGHAYIKSTFNNTIVSLTDPPSPHSLRPRLRLVAPRSTA